MNDCQPVLAMSHHRWERRDSVMPIAQLLGMLRARETSNARHSKIHIGSRTISQQRRTSPNSRQRPRRLSDGRASWMAAPRAEGRREARGTTSPNAYSLGLPILAAEVLSLPVVVASLLPLPPVVATAVVTPAAMAVLAITMPTTPPTETTVMYFDNTGSRRRGALHAGNAAHASCLRARYGNGSDCEQCCSSCDDRLQSHVYSPVHFAMEEFNSIVLSCGS